MSRLAKDSQIETFAALQLHIDMALGDVPSTFARENVCPSARRSHGYPERRRPVSIPTTPCRETISACAEPE